MKRPPTIYAHHAGGEVTARRIPTFSGTASAFYIIQTDDRDGNRVGLYLNQEQAEGLADALARAMAVTP